MALRLKSSGCEEAIQLEGWGQLSRRKPQHLQDSPDGKSSLAEARVAAEWGAALRAGRDCVCGVGGGGWTECGFI